MSLTLSKFFFDIPIYTPVKIGDDSQDTFRKIIDYHNKEEFDGYNPWKQVESTFVVTTDLIPTGESFVRDGGYGIVRIKCKRTDDQFRYYILWDPNTNHLTKVGQHPSIADFHISEIKQYKKLLSHEKLKEFTRAIGLAANGVGIGSFVYLRRIFEHLIFEAYQQCLADGVVTEEQYNRSRMDQKIELLSTHLPRFLVENKSIYSILSLGIHELDENTCLAHFDTLRVGIEIILDEKLDDLKKKEKIEEAKKKLGQLHSATSTS
ncbi:hypothetical protein SAMN05216296_3289 [Pseudomonas pohangensis]|uniref:Uncharacterized protein n=1 Tax=Pseudomonas pohangensis TaxID=364197 RepID=A0A1H2HW11_9PSED|nr:hypothetical protein [Pseudomonas pohangensis]SDU35748.1 hypothetical protein SAMN05216296_3289 [Pseudomonas pohangensis]